MPVTDAGLRARILYAETRDLAEDKPGDLKLIRDRLAELIAASDAGVGFARPLDPTMFDLGQKDLVAAWQECVAAPATRRAR